MLGTSEQERWPGALAVVAVGALVVLCGCERGIRLCGDGTATALEECDGSDLKGATCQSIGFYQGTLRCNDQCLYDTSGCVEDVCEVFDLRGDGEWCDPCEALGGPPDPDCAALCGVGDGQCSPPTYYSAAILDWTCRAAGFIEHDPDCGTCGNGVGEVEELCDGTDLRGMSCLLFGFDGGRLACSTECVYDLTYCE